MAKKNAIEFGSNNVDENLQYVNGSNIVTQSELATWLAETRVKGATKVIDHDTTSSENSSDQNINIVQ